MWKSHSIIKEEWTFITLDTDLISPNFINTTEKVNTGQMNTPFTSLSSYIISWFIIISIFFYYKKYSWNYTSILNYPWYHFFSTTCVDLLKIYIKNLIKILYYQEILILLFILIMYSIEFVWRKKTINDRCLRIKKINVKNHYKLTIKIQTTKNK